MDKEIGKTSSPGKGVQENQVLPSGPSRAQRSPIQEVPAYWGNMHLEEIMKEKK